MKQVQKLYPHLLAVLGFVFIALIYFLPVLQGKKIYQSDIVQFTAMAKEQNDFRAAEHAEPYWTNAAFGGMPTYQMGANYPHDYIGKLDDALRFLPRPADYLFLYFLGFYGLMLVLKIDPLKAFFGALAFGFSTYMIIILGVGHNAKAHAIAYMPLVVAGVILVFRKKYVFGGLLTMLAVALEINANHFQMTYYLLFLLLVLGIYFGYKFFKNKEFKELAIVSGTFAVAVIFALGANATSLMATKEFTDYSIRGKSDLTITPEGTKKTETTTLDRSYITEYSYGVAESLNLIAPRLFGGGNGEKLSDDSAVYDYMLKYGASEEEARQFTDSYAPTYWGTQPIVAAPAYIGAVVFFLAVLGLYHDKRKIRYVFLIGALLSLVLSWGKNFSVVTDFFIDFVPLYDKFRAVSSIQVVLELCFPVLAIIGLQSFFTNYKEKQWDSLWKTAATTLGLLVLLFLCRSLFDFSGSMDGQLRQMFSQSQDKSFEIGFIDALKTDRKTMYAADLLRSGFFIAAAAIALWAYTKNKIASTTAIVIVGLLMVTDLVFVDKNYVSNKDFVSAHEVDIPFTASPTDEQLMLDTTNYRVLDVEGYLNAKASYFHKSIGGYSAVRPRRMQELFDYQIAKNNKRVLDMLNVKYIIQSNDKGEEVASINPAANGNAWFVKELRKVNSNDAEMKALDKLDNKNVAVTQKEVSVKVGLPRDYVTDSTAIIEQTYNKPNHLKYSSNNKNEGFAVFSEMYYKNGWNATIDGKATDIINVDFALRGMLIPAGKHLIEFKFEPQVVKTGSTIALVSSIGMLLLLVLGFILKTKSRKNH
ncbi:YfhO family protein [Flavobacterium sp.]|uniref:YfhO family protein n=1 Tax=Flavobacterium sp. TaxID=239 RepID=UPI003BC94818